MPSNKIEMTLEVSKLELERERMTEDDKNLKGGIMRKIVEEISGEGLDKLLGKRVTFFCLNYIYAGDLVGVNDDCVLLKNAEIVYETGPLESAKWKDAQKLPGDDWYVQRLAIESYGVMK